MIANETFTLMVAYCEDLFANCYRHGLAVGAVLGIIIGFMFFLAWFMVVRKDILKEDKGEMRKPRTDP